MARPKKEMEQEKVIDMWCTLERRPGKDEFVKGDVLIRWGLDSLEGNSWWVCLKNLVGEEEGLKIVGQEWAGKVKPLVTAPAETASATVKA